MFEIAVASRRQADDASERCPAPEARGRGGCDEVPRSDQDSSGTSHRSALGRESPSTTHMYVEADLAMKERALARLKPPEIKPT